MSENESTGTAGPANKKSGASTPKRIRIIGGPPIKTPPDIDFQQVPFTLLGLSKAEGIEHADLIVYWPSADLFKRKIIAEELTMLTKMIVNGNVPNLFGFHCKRLFATDVDLEKEVVRHKDLFVLGPSFRTKLGKDQPLRDYRFAISLLPTAGRPNSLESLKPLLENHIIYSWLHDEDLKEGNWSGYGEYCGVCDPAFAAYAESSGLAAPENFIESIVTAVLGQAFPAIYRGATVAVTVPSGFLSPSETWSIPPPFRHAYSWLSPLINCKRALDGDDKKAEVKNRHQIDTEFTRHLQNWRKLECEPRVFFTVARQNSDGSTDMVSEGIFRPTELKSAAAHYPPGIIVPEDSKSQRQENPARKIEEPIHLCPARADRHGNALSLAFKFGAGGLVLMTEPQSLETLLGIKTEYIPFKKIEPTNERLQLRGSKFYFIVRVTLATSEVVNVPMMPITFTRFLAFCVAGLLADKDGSDGAMDVTTSKIGNYNLSKSVPPIYNEHPHKPRQNVNRAFEKKLKGKADCNIIGDSPGEKKYSLNPSLRRFVDLAALQKRIKAAKKCDKHDDAIQKIIAVLN